MRISKQRLFFAVCLFAFLSTVCGCGSKQGDLNDEVLNVTKESPQSRIYGQIQHVATYGYYDENGTFHFINSIPLGKEFRVIVSDKTPSKEGTSKTTAGNINKFELDGNSIYVGQEAGIAQSRLSAYLTRMIDDPMKEYHSTEYSYKGKKYIIMYGPGSDGSFVVKSIKTTK
jgi:hypothetical protein